MNAIIIMDEWKDVAQHTKRSKERAHVIFTVDARYATHTLTYAFKYYWSGCATYFSYTRIKTSSYLMLFALQ
jgi:hypothetical protein